MPSRDLPARSVEHAARVWPLAVVPLVATLLDWSRVAALLGPTDEAFNVTFGVPRPVTTLWSFVNVDPGGVTVRGSAVGPLSAFVVSLVVSTVLSGVLAAGYLGSIDAALRGRYEFLAAVRAYARPLVGFALLEAAVGILLVVAGLAGTPALVVVGVALFVLAYLFFAAPYLVVVADLGLVAALERAVELATTDGRVPGFFVGYLVVSAVVSVPLSWVAFNYPPAGVGVAALASAPLALVLNVATLLFVRELVGAESDAAPAAAV